MARQAKQDVENNFVRGLITETTAIRFPKDACTETYNCIFSETGKVTRRLGIDYEDSYSQAVLPRDDDAAWSEFVWTAVSGDGDISFLVVQRGSVIEFYNISTTTGVVSDNKETFSISLTSHIPAGSALDPAVKPCKFAQGGGNLVIVNPHCNPLLVEYDETLNAIEATTITVKSRDLVGVDDGLTVTERVTATAAVLKTSNPKHYYNLINQGWGSVTALADWDTARTDVPSNADTVGLYRLSATDAFDNTLVVANSPGNTPAPRGHYILDVHGPDRTQALVDEGITGVNLSNEETAISYGGSSNFGSLPTLANAFDGNVATTTALFFFIGDIAHIGKTFAAPTAVSRIEINLTCPSGQGFWIYGKNGAAPASSTDGTVLSSLVYTSGGVSSVYVTNPVPLWDHVWLRTQAFNAGTVTIKEIVMYTLDATGNEEPITYTRPSSTAFYAGRAWYAGTSGLDLNSTLFFSQIVQKSDDYNNCYQKNDPTSEDFSELLPDDGGYIKVPEIANVTHIATFHNALLVFATNGVWAVSGSNKQYFTATSFGVRKISGVGTSAGQSFIDAKGMPYWWGESGIYTVKYDPNYDAYEVVSLSDESVFTFFNNIPPACRKYVKGTYDIDTETITWIYNTTTAGWIYNAALVFNTLSKAFYPWTISTSDDVPYPDVRGIIHVRAATDASSSITKFLCTTFDPTLEYFTFAEFKDDEYVDWASFSGGVNYSSYFITGYMIDGGLMRNSKPTYVMVYLEDQVNAGAYLRGIFDWTTTPSEGKTSSSQQIYHPYVTNRVVRARKLKVRGNGRALQLKMYSDGSKPFTIVGWALTVTTDGV